MKILISYPPLANTKGCPTLGQNRQFQYFKAPTYIYPLVPAWAATMLKAAGHEVIWNDCLAEGLDLTRFHAMVQAQKPDIVVFETKTPVIKQLWRIIDAIKEKSVAGQAPQLVLCGDHVTALPEESFVNSKVDFVLTGGDYDFLLVNLCEVLAPYLLRGAGVDAQGLGRLEAGIYFRSGLRVVNTGLFKLNHNLDLLPFIDRDLTHSECYAYKNGNYKRVPGTYIASGRDCWWGKCSFCSWTSLYPNFRVRKPDNVLDEIDYLISRWRVREIMDDTGCFPVGDWLRNFCIGVVKRGYHQKVYFDCNMRFGALSHEDYAVMKKANFRLLLFGLESASQATRDRINKNVTYQQIIQDCRSARQAGLYPHITIMFGYPWENYSDALATMKLGQWLLRKGLAYTMQATIVIPYPGTPLFKECQQRGWLKTTDWDDFDMKQPVMLSSIPDSALARLVRNMYKISFHPEFIARKILAIEGIDDIRYYLRAAGRVYSHLIDFKGTQAVET